MNLWKRFHQHDWQLSYMVCEFHKYHCKRRNCNEKRFTIETRPTFNRIKSENGEIEKYERVDATCKELTPEEAVSYNENAIKSLNATMWILDNVEPTYSAGRNDNTDYHYKTENGKIVEK